MRKRMNETEVSRTEMDRKDLGRNQMSDRISKIRKQFLFLAVAVLSLILLAGCGQDNALADCYDEAAVKQQAMDDVTLAESDQYEGWKARFEEKLQPVLTEDSYKSYLDTLAKKGAFKEFGKCAILGQEKDGVDYAVAVVIAKHEEGNIQYTIVFDEEMKLVSFTI